MAAIIENFHKAIQGSLDGIESKITRCNSRMKSEGIGNHDDSNLVNQLIEPFESRLEEPRYCLAQIERDASSSVSLLKLLSLAKEKKRLNDVLLNAIAVDHGLETCSKEDQATNNEPLTDSPPKPILSGGLEASIDEDVNSDPPTPKLSDFGLSANRKHYFQDENLL